MKRLWTMILSLAAVLCLAGCAEEEAAVNQQDLYTHVLADYYDIIANPDG